jgi:DnaJ-class molecular chaperone
VSVVLLIIAAAVVVGWWATVQRHPIRKCPACKGSKKNAGSNSERWGTCRRCGGKGEVRRLGGGKTQRAMKAGSAVPDEERGTA